MECHESWYFVMLKCRESWLFFSSLGTALRFCNTVGSTSSENMLAYRKSKGHAQQPDSYHAAHVSKDLRAFVRVSRVHPLTYLNSSRYSNCLFHFKFDSGCFVKLMLQLSLHVFYFSFQVRNVKSGVAGHTWYHIVHIVHLIPVYVYQTRYQVQQNCYPPQ